MSVPFLLAKQDWVKFDGAQVVCQLEVEFNH